MRSSFFELNVAISGIHSSRAQLATTFHNISNEGTPGYSRQYAQQRAGIALSYGSRGMVGSGSLVYGVDQHRDIYLDTKYWYQRGKGGDYSAKLTQSNLIQSTLGLFDTAAGSRISTFFSAVESLANSPSSYSDKQILSDSAQSLIDYFNNTADALSQQQKDINEEIQIVVDRINTIGKQIQALNEQIARQEMSGNKANDLRDQRALLVDELSQYVNVSTSERTNDLGVKEYYVYVNNYAFVSHYQLNEMECVKRTEKTNPEDVEGLVDVVWKHSGKNIVDGNLTGQLKGLVDIRDGNNGNYFSGYITNVTYPTAPSTDIVIEMAGFNRDDMLETGIITVNGKQYYYTDLEYDYTVNPPTCTLIVQDDGNVTVAAGDTLTIGKTTDYQGIPYYQNMLNEFCRTLAMAYNEGTNRNGEDLGITGHYNSFGEDNSTGIYFFTYDGQDSLSPLDYSKITASNFTLSKEILEDIGNIATSLTANAGADDNSSLLELASLANNRDIFKQGSFASYMESVIVTIGVNTRELQTNSELQSDLVNSVQSQRLSVSGVDRDEETANMVMYQMIYNTCARIVQTIDQMYTTLINLGA